MDNLMNLTFRPLTSGNWNDLEVLFGPGGACEGCWCMFWMLRRVDYEKLRKTGGTKNMFRGIVQKGVEPGILAYYKDTPIGWCAIQPREKYIKLETSKILKPVDDQKVWSIVCFFVDRKYRNQGITKQLISEAIIFARSKGAKIIEAYPVEPRKKTSSAFIYTGISTTFSHVGFTEVARRSPSRPIMRYYF